MISFEKIDERYDIYRFVGKDFHPPKIAYIEGRKYYRFMNYFYITDHPDNLDERYVSELNDMRYHYKNIVIDYEYNSIIEKKMIISVLKNTKINKEPEKILDFGCGEGGTEKLLIPHFPNLSLYGVDIRNIEISYLNEYTDFKQVDINKELPFKSNFFDLTIAFFVFHFRITDIQIESIYRTLKKNGLLCFNLIKSANRHIIDRFLAVGFVMEKSEKITFKDKLGEYFIFRKE